MRLEIHPTRPINLRELPKEKNPDGKTQYISEFKYVKPDLTRATKYGNKKDEILKDKNFDKVGNSDIFLKGPYLVAKYGSSREDKKRGYENFYKLMHQLPSDYRIIYKKPDDDPFSPSYYENLGFKSVNRSKLKSDVDLLKSTSDKDSKYYIMDPNDRGTYDRAIHHILESYDSAIVARHLYPTNDPIEDTPVRAVVAAPVPTAATVVRLAGVMPPLETDAERIARLAREAAQAEADRIAREAVAEADRIAREAAAQAEIDRLAALAAAARADAERIEHEAVQARENANKADADRLALEAAAAQAEAERIERDAKAARIAEAARVEALRKQQMRKRLLSSDSDDDPDHDPTQTTLNASKKTPQPEVNDTDNNVDQSILNASKHAATTQEKTQEETHEKTTEEKGYLKNFPQGFPAFNILGFTNIDTLNKKGDIAQELQAFYQFEITEEGRKSELIKKLNKIKNKKYITDKEFDSISDDKINELLEIRSPKVRSSKIKKYRGSCEFNKKKITLAIVTVCIAVLVVILSFVVLRYLVVEFPKWVHKLIALGLGLATGLCLLSFSGSKQSN